MLILNFCLLHKPLITCIFKTITKSLGMYNQNYVSIAYKTLLRFNMYMYTSVYRYIDLHFVL